MSPRLHELGYYHGPRERGKKIFVPDTHLQQLLPGHCAQASVQYSRSLAQYHILTPIITTAAQPADAEEVSRAIVTLETCVLLALGLGGERGRSKSKG